MDYTADELSVMRVWLTVTFGRDSIIDTDDLSETEVLEYVAQNYGGGVQQFLSDLRG